MKKIILALCLGVFLAGCGKSAQEQSAAGDSLQRQEAAKKLFAQSMIFLQEKNLKASVDSLKASIALDPSDPNPYLVLGQLLIKAEEFDNAVQFLENATRTFPNNGTVYYMLSVANRMAGNKLPAVLAARKSYEVFNAAGDQVNSATSAALLQEMITEAQAAEEVSRKTSAKVVKFSEELMLTDKK